MHGVDLLVLFLVVSDELVEVGPLVIFVVSL
jgi:hypothetical protein